MSEINNPNPQDANANPETKIPETTVTNPTDPAENSVDYKKKFAESSKEALRLLEENKARDLALKEKEDEIARLKANGGASYSNNSDAMYPGYENLGEEEKKNVIAFTQSVKRDVLSEVQKDPANTFSRQLYNENVWNKAFEGVVSEFPELKDAKDDFKTKYFRPDNVPSNIGELMKDIAKVYLFDKAKDVGAREATERQNRVDAERANGGDKAPATERTAEDWAQIAKNPSQFAKLSKEFNAALASGKLK